jgi:hypothetical protein
MESKFMVAFDGDNHKNLIHTDSGAREFGFRSSLVSGVNIFSWSVDDIIQVGIKKLIPSEIYI